MGGCRKQTKKVFRHIGQNLKASFMRSAVDIVTALDDVSFQYLDGTMKQDIAVETLRNVARREGQELRGSAIRAVVNGIVTAVRDGIADVEEIGIDDSATESLPD